MISRAFVEMVGMFSVVTIFGAVVEDSSTRVVAKKGFSVVMISLVDMVASSIVLDSPEVVGFFDVVMGVSVSGSSSIVITAVKLNTVFILNFTDSVIKGISLEGDSVFFFSVIVS